MKKVTVFMLILTSLIAAQGVKELNSVSTDSIDIRALVQQQIENARNKKSEVFIPVKQEVVEAIPAPVVTEKPKAAQSDSPFAFFLNQPAQYKFYEIVSLVIIGFVVIRRVLSNADKKTRKDLKAKIGMMRDEKVSGIKIDPKLQKIRKVLKDKLDIFKQSEKHLARTARELNVSQGELLLAARLKYYEMKKL